MYIKDGMCWISYTGPAGRVRQSTGLPDTTKNRKAAADIVAALRLNAGRHGGCPVLVFGITPKLIEDWNP